MASSRSEQSDPQSGEGGILLHVQGESTAFPLADRFPSAIGPSKICSLERGSTDNAPEASHFRGHGRISGILLPDFHCTEERRYIQARHRSVSPEQAYQQAEVQDGDSQLRQIINPTRRLGNIPGSERRVLPRLDAQEDLEVSTIRLGRQRLPVRSSSVRPLHRSLHLYDGYQGTRSSSEGERHQVEDVPGRLAESEQRPDSMRGGYFKTGGSNPSPGFQHKTREVRLHSVTPVPVLRDALRHGYLHGPPKCIEDRQSQRVVVEPSAETICTLQDSTLLAREDGIHVQPLTSSTGTQTPVSEGADEQSQEPNTVQPTCGSNSMVCQSHGTMDKSGMAQPICPNQTIGKGGLPSYGCLNQWMGGSHRHTHGFWPVDPSGIPLPYKSPGDGSSEPCHEGPSCVFERSSCHPLRGQYYVPLIFTQARWDEIQETLDQSGRDTQVDVLPGDNDLDRVHPRKTECSGRHAQSSKPNSSDRMDDCSPSTRTCVDIVRQTDGGSVCNRVQQQTESVHVPDERPEGSRPRRLLDQLVGNGSLRLPPHSTDPESTGEVSQRSSQTHPGNSILGGNSMVPGPVVSLTRKVSKPKPKAKTPSSTKIRNTARKSRYSEANRMAVISHGLKKSGLSQQATDIALKARRPSTVKNYKHKWRTWVGYCNSRVRKIDPERPKAHHIADFLAHLHVTKSLQHATLLNYRSAILNTLKFSRGIDIPHLVLDPMAKQVLDGIKNDQPKKTIRQPFWDVFLVLKYLRSPAFEPIAECSIEKLSQKTLFLVMLACSRRMSGIHGLSGLDRDIEFTKNNRSMILNFLPEFRAKNQDALHSSPAIEIKSLITDDDDRYNCPVRALRYYLSRTESYRRLRRRLFLSVRPGYTYDLSQNALSLWIRCLITNAYKAEKLAPPKGASKTHEVRKLSTSLGFSKNVSLADLMKSAYWRSQNTFTSHYLLDITVKKRDDTYGINSLVAATTLIKL